MLKVGDTIKCADKDDLVETHNILQRQGYDTDFLYEKDGKKGVMCKECRIAERQRKCGLIKTVGHPGKDEDEKCLGFDIMENCKRCIAYTGFDWEKEARKFKF